MQNSLVAASGLHPGPLHWEHGVLATRPPGLHFYLDKIDFVSVLLRLSLHFCLDKIDLFPRLSMFRVSSMKAKTEVIEMHHQRMYHLKGACASRTIFSLQFVF